jgi:hypothetical protein
MEPQISKETIDKWLKMASDHGQGMPKDATVTWLKRSELEKLCKIVARESVGPRHPTVVRWRNNGIESCAKIAEAYGNDQAAVDMRVMITKQAPDQEAPAPQVPDFTPPAPERGTGKDSEPAHSAHLHLTTTMTTITQAKEEGREAYCSDADLEKDNPYSSKEQPDLHIAWRTGYQGQSWTIRWPRTTC